MDRYITGKVEGRAEGRAEGIAEGKVEEKYGIARNLLKKGSDIDFVVECTGLTRDIVQKILESKQAEKTLIMDIYIKGRTEVRYQVATKLLLLIHDIPNRKNQILISVKMKI